MVKLFLLFNLFFCERLSGLNLLIVLPLTLQLSVEHNMFAVLQAHRMRNILCRGHRDAVA